MYRRCIDRFALYSPMIKSIRTIEMQSTILSKAGRVQVVGHKATPKSVFFCCLELGHTIQLRRTNCWYTTVRQHKDREASYSQCTLHRRRLYSPSSNALWHVAEYFSMATFNLIVFMRPTLFFFIERHSPSPYVIFSLFSIS